MIQIIVIPNRIYLVAFVCLCVDGLVERKKEKKIQFESKKTEKRKITVTGKRLTAILFLCV